MKKKLAMLTVAVAVICGLIAVGPAVQPVALAEGEDPLLQAIGEITAELQEVNSTLKDMVPKGEQVKKPKVEWTGQYTMDVPGFELLQTMCDDIFAASKGRLVLDLRQDLCPADEEFNAVDQGDIDFAISTRPFPVSSFPAAGLFNFRCGGMSPMEKYLWLISGGGAELGQEMIDDSDVYIVPGGGQIWPPGIFLWSNRQITVPDDLDGLKMRCAGDCGWILSSMGASTVFLTGDLIYEAMEKGGEEGGIDACEFSCPCLDWEFKFHEVATYVYLSECREPHSYFPLVVNEDRWSGLPDDLRVIVEKLAREQVTKSYAEVCQCDLDALANIEGYGCTVDRLPGDVEEEFLEKAADFYDEQALVHPGLYKEMLDSQRDFQEAFRAVWPRP